MQQLKKAICLDEVFEELLPKGPQDWLLVDVDGTLIHPVDAVFRGPRSLNPYKNFLDVYKSQDSFSSSVDQEDYYMTLSHFRRDRQVALLDPRWLDLFNAYHQVGAKIFGLTKMDTGAFGILESVEKWRFKELTELGLHFTIPPEARDSSDPVVVKAPVGKDFASTFYQGVLFTGSASKSEALAGFLQMYKTKPERIFFIDDKRENLDDLYAYCKKTALPYLGIEYRQTDALEADFSEARARFQINHLFQHKQWLSDKEADQIWAQNHANHDKNPSS